MERKLKTIYTCYPEGRYKALTMSYDDGLIYDRRLVDIFNKNGIKGTFHLNVVTDEKREDVVRFDEIKELYKGHEVSAHTLYHPTIERCPLDQVVQQIIENRKELERACGYPVRGMSYPNGSYSDDIIKLLPACGIEYCRVVGNTDDFLFPSEPLAWMATCHHSHNLMENAKNFIEFNKSQYLRLMYVWGHSYEFEWNNTWEEIEEFCTYVGNRDDIWYATNIEILDYMNAAKNLKYTASGDMVYNPSAISVWISVDGKIYRVDGGKTVVFD